MKIVVRAFGGLKKKLGHRFELELEPGSTVGELLRVLENRAGVPGRFVAEGNEIAPDILVYVNGLSVNVGGRALERLSDGDVVSLLPPSGGG